MSTPTTTATPFQGSAPSTPPPTTTKQAHAREMQNAARELREAIRNNVDQKLIQAQAQEAAAAALAQTRVFQVTPPTPPEAPRPVIIRRPNGETFTISPGAFNNVIPPQVVDISIAFFVTLAVTSSACRLRERSPGEWIGAAREDKCRPTWARRSRT